MLFFGCSAVALVAGPKPAFSIFFISAQLFPWALFAFLYISAVCVVEISLKSLLLFPWWLSGKESACQCRRHRRRGFDPWVWKIPWRKAWQPFLPRKSHGQRRLVGYSLWGHKESGTTEHGENTHTPSHTYLLKVVCPPKSAFLEGELHIHTHTHTHTHTHKITSHAYLPEVVCPPNSAFLKNELSDSCLAVVFQC